MLSIHELLLQIVILAEIYIKIRYFYRKIAKHCLKLGISPPDPLAFDGWELRPKTANPLFKIPGYTIAPHGTHHSFNAEYQTGKLDGVGNGAGEGAGDGAGKDSKGKV